LVIGTYTRHNTPGIAGDDTAECELFATLGGEFYGTLPGDMTPGIVGDHPFYDHRPILIVAVDGELDGGNRISAIGVAKSYSGNNINPILGIYAR
jgi:hypothetical protein